MKSTHLLSKTDEMLVTEAIAAAEKQTSGEIVVHIETSCPEDVLDRAAWIFKSLKLHKTAQRNGVLFYIAVSDKKFAIIGDAGINAAVPVGFWEDVKSAVLTQFAKGNFAQGLVDGISLSGQKLNEFFPCLKDDKNELSNEISYGQE